MKIFSSVEVNKRRKQDFMTNMYIIEQINA